VNNSNSTKDSVPVTLGPDRVPESWPWSPRHTGVVSEGASGSTLTCPTRVCWPGGKGNLANGQTTQRLAGPTTQAEHCLSVPLSSSIGHPAVQRVELASTEIRIQVGYVPVEGNMFRHSGRVPK